MREGVIGLVVGAIGGLALGFVMFSSDPAAVEAPVPTQAPRPDVTVETQFVDASGDALRKCEQQLSVLQGLWDKSIEASTGERSVFPEALPPQYQAGSYETAFDEAAAACPELELEKHFVDCEEYPCLVFYSSGSGSLSECEAWSSKFTGPINSTATNTVYLEDGERRYRMMGALAPDVQHDQANTRLRVNQRRKRGHERLEDEWGAVELSEAERLDRQIEEWRAKAEAGEPMADQMLEMMEAKRANME